MRTISYQISSLRHHAQTSCPVCRPHRYRILRPICLSKLGTASTCCSWSAQCTHWKRISAELPFSADTFAIYSLSNSSESWDSHCCSWGECWWSWSWVYIFKFLKSSYTVWDSEICALLHWNIAKLALGQSLLKERLQFQLLFLHIGKGGGWQ